MWMLYAQAQTAQQGQPASAERGSVLSPGQSAPATAVDSTTTTAPSRNVPVSAPGQNAPADSKPGSGTQQPPDKKKPNR